jgi:catechol 2,3-dioxygenase-like lactoylglutathione lyase family enzyme
MNYELQLIQVPVSEVDASIEFYAEKAGFNLDHDHQVGDGIRFVQMTPVGSACSIAFGTGLGSSMAPGDVDGLQLVVGDIDVAREELSGRGVEVGDVQDFPWGRFLFFSDPDGNGWAIQQPIRPGA